jgi:hypothetical protein
MHPFVVGPLSVDAFLESFLPPCSQQSPFTAGMFNPLIDKLSEPETTLYNKFVSFDPCLATLLAPFFGLIFPFQIDIAAQFLPHLIIKNTHRSRDKAPFSKFPHGLQPDCSVYGNTKEMLGKEELSETYLDFSRVEFIVEFKRDPRSDPFVDKSSEGGTLESNLTYPEGGTSNLTCPEGGMPNHTYPEGGMSNHSYPEEGSSNHSYLEEGSSGDSCSKKGSSGDSCSEERSSNITNLEDGSSNHSPPEEGLMNSSYLEEGSSSDSCSEGGTSNLPEGMSANAFDVLGQLTAYATSILSGQYRTHTFMVLIVKDYARLIRWDRSGAVFTKPINFNEDPHLIDFFIRYGLADREARGHDITVSPASSQDVKDAQVMVPELRGVTRCLDVTLSDQHFIIPAPTSTPDIPVGRWTRGSFAYDQHNKRRVFLKDSWRVLLDDVKPEGEIYSLLYEKGVPNIPFFSLAGDVGNEAYHRSRTDEIVDDQNFELCDHDPSWKLTPHRHYRIVLLTVGRTLDKFNCTREFVQAMCAALKGKWVFS